ncbi:hypothetical protein KFU94_60950 [Chloroflexi bacterium TSY]|nr:hypothetical protein [Chloroflexi bacterium TSY]
MAQTITTREDAYAWMEQHKPLTPKVGDLAPDFELFDVAGKDSIRLSSLQGKTPVALVFGSFT